MKFVKLEVNNYRNFDNIVLDLSNKNVIFGLNDIGKSNLLSVFRLLFDRKFRANNCIESDYHNKNTEKDKKNENYLQFYDDIKISSKKYDW